MQAMGYWYKQKKLFEIPNLKHINYIITYPEKFGFTEEYITAMYAKHGEKMNMEGKAREELIIESLEHGWVRVRHYEKPRDYWSIQYWDFRKQEKDLRELVETLMLDKNIMGKEDELIFIGFGDSSRYDYAYTSGGAKKFLAEKTIKKTKIVSVKLFEDM